MDARGHGTLRTRPESTRLYPSLHRVTLVRLRAISISLFPLSQKIPERRACDEALLRAIVPVAFCTRSAPSQLTIRVVGWRNVLFQSTIHVDTSPINSRFLFDPHGLRWKR